MKWIISLKYTNYFWRKKVCIKNINFQLISSTTTI